MPNAALFPEYGTTLEPIFLGDIQMLPNDQPLADLFPDFTVRLEARTGDSPIEDGSLITDHAAARPERLRLVGAVSNLGVGDAGPFRPRRAMDNLRFLIDNIIPVRAVGPWGEFRECIVTRMVARPRGRGMRYRMELKRIQRVALETEMLREATVSGPAVGRTGPVDRGRVATEEAAVETLDLTQDPPQVREPDPPSPLEDFSFGDADLVLPEPAGPAGPVFRQQESDPILDRAPTLEGVPNTGL